MDVSQAIIDFTTLAIRSGGYMAMDRVYVQNKMLALIGEESLNIDLEPSTEPNAQKIAAFLIQTAQKNGQISAGFEGIFEAELMDFLTPPPSVVNAYFAEHYHQDPKTATDYFYELCQQNNYIQTLAIAKNQHFIYDCQYGQLEITINLSKPEKDPKQIALEKSLPKSDYPKCLLCMENEGYLGRLNHPARTNHRLIRMNLEGESWGFQYSPYAYFNEHSIILSEIHRPMKISKQTFRRLLKIVEILPHYFVGSNADLPIVGGSILSHDHYQAGRHQFPMEQAEIRQYFELPDYLGVTAGIVKWPMSVIRLSGYNIDELVEASQSIFQQWQDYSDSSVEVVAKTPDGVQHHTVTPIARRLGNQFEIDLVLRDNNVSEQYPDGIFHPHPEVHHIKKENIGLIEVMGLAILPGRLKAELETVKSYILGEVETVAAYHQDWAKQLKDSYQNQLIDDYISEALGQKFLTVLEHAGVFKDTETGHKAFDRFIAQLTKG
ncbi:MULTISPECIES: UDP-glucose--hexose-1-phosphate uridylyltransferase [unclassified Enterococcus]|uniref:UDP-glucose--hexose-1-phosphate uridylyltransferase n=1 Tax=unclassified Enterococcus TaxID=2608891 RepID=UPI001551D82F|nr:MULTISPECIES: UDP-glucose--hexose-1-phosphate uridylyltransferase [unclassified Enterococcus]MBS7578047.1 UDP-glucose--hexose-1-phosphate uridylyltransferase [Enterococcus sp. MMGLQ5-2]MBS7585263.1 UDP-glucose--hexose-1-phosphate uridylyltransferase [Enterococcus sp. MMGLQ5-1]NPD13120.1 UDP-glucose--hexose-1-phosphate uridylyltransferase [Enterococcus sp. MMGLQ5-1]NPD37878.1 UDP-glucose--hexose-1-phosphate uridylyltransferase [Enterococcus sp. MMGLQ5-2]